MLNTLVERRSFVPVLKELAYHPTYTTHIILNRMPSF